MSQTSQHQDPRLEALQAAYDRVNSWEETATPETIREALDEALREVGIDVDEETRGRLAKHIHEGGGREDVAAILG
jgi:hypothetical protein